ncbi:hypothetical protein QFZ30_002643 [Arthrobacter pascens]|uniref:hypothetical protein n=1 Tax=Arthrobacter pascens TaxID=1677 RepID=UPI002792A62A|nr:hypothetical protein [Arthrobacter pascens]MDQ0679261.1 hypothetical protein [Arthrobacter pascens]
MQTPSPRVPSPRVPSPRLPSQRLPSESLPQTEVPATGGPARAAQDAGGGPPQPTGLMKAMTPGVVDYLFRQLVAGESPEDVQWQQEGVTLSAQPAGAELARRLAETDLEALTPMELFDYVRAAQRLASWAEGLREEAVGRYCRPVVQPGGHAGQSDGPAVERSGTAPRPDRCAGS